MGSCTFQFEILLIFTLILVLYQVVSWNCRFLIFFLIQWRNISWHQRCAVCWRLSWVSILECLSHCILIILTKRNLLSWNINWSSLRFLRLLDEACLAKLEFMIFGITGWPSGFATHALLNVVIVGFLTAIAPASWSIAFVASTRILPLGSTTLSSAPLKASRFPFINGLRSIFDDISSISFFLLGTLYFKSEFFNLTFICSFSLGDFGILDFLISCCNFHTGTLLSSFCLHNWFITWAFILDFYEISLCLLEGSKHFLSLFESMLFFSCVCSNFSICFS